MGTIIIDRVPNFGTAVMLNTYDSPGINPLCPSSVKVLPTEYGLLHRMSYSSGQYQDSCAQLTGIIDHYDQFQTEKRSEQIEW